MRWGEWQNNQNALFQYLVILQVFVLVHFWHLRTCKFLTGVAHICYFVKISNLSKQKLEFSCCDYIKKYSRPIGFLYSYRPINIILSADWSDYIKDITRRLSKSVQKLYNRPIVGRRSADTSADDKWRATIGRSSADGRPTLRPIICGSFKYDIGRLIGRSSADHQPIAKTPKLSADGKKIITR